MKRDTKPILNEVLYLNNYISLTLLSKPKIGILKVVYY